MRQRVPGNQECLARCQGCRRGSLIREEVTENTLRTPTLKCAALALPVGGKLVPPLHQQGGQAREMIRGRERRHQGSHVITQGWLQSVRRFTLCTGGL